MVQSSPYLYNFVYPLKITLSTVFQYRSHTSVAKAGRKSTRLYYKYPFILLSSLGMRLVPNSKELDPLWHIIELLCMNVCAMYKQPSYTVTSFKGAFRYYVLSLQLCTAEQFESHTNTLAEISANASHSETLRLPYFCPIFSECKHDQCTLQKTQRSPMYPEQITPAR